MAMIGKVRRMHFRESKTVREIARATSLSRNTVRKYLRVEQVDQPRYRREAAPTKLTPFHEASVQALKVDARRPKRERRTAQALHKELAAAGYDGGYSRLTDFIRAWRAGAGQAMNAAAFVPLDQAKAYKPGHRVTHDDVRAMLGTLSTDANASKGVVTTTSDFQPGILLGDEFQRFMPYRLELKNGAQLAKWLSDITSSTPPRQWAGLQCGLTRLFDADVKGGPHLRRSFPFARSTPTFDRDGDLPSSLTIRIP